MRLLDKLNHDYKIDLKLSQLENLENSDQSLVLIIEGIVKKKLKFSESTHLEEYFDDYKGELKNLLDKIIQIEEKLNDKVYSLYGITNSQKKIILDDLR